MSADHSIEERERLTRMCEIAYEDAARMAIRSREGGAWSLADDYELRAIDWQKIAAILRAPTRAPEEGTRIEGWVSNLSGIAEVWVVMGKAMLPDDVRATLILHPSDPEEAKDG